ADKANPNCLTLPRYWVREEDVAQRLVGHSRRYLLAWRDITNAANERTMIAMAMPRSAVGNNAPLVLGMESPEALACFGTFVFDLSARFKAGFTHLNFYILEQLPVLPPAAFADIAPWDPARTVTQWLRPRVAELACTAMDMRPLAEELG